MQYRSIKILGVPVACVTYDSALETVKGFAGVSRPTAVCPANTHILGEARHDPDFGRVMARFDLVLPDGMPVVWALNCRGAGLADRVYGPYFMKHVLKNTPSPWRHFFFGDTEQCLADLRRVAAELQPNIQIVGAISPPFRPWTESEENAFAEAINAPLRILYGLRFPVSGWNDGSLRIKRVTNVAYFWRWATRSLC